MPDKGYVHVYTGDGKGKTTAALGLALRAAGHGLRVFIGQFMKGIAYGEVAAVECFAGRIVVERFGENTMVHPEAPRSEDLARARAGLARIRDVVQSGDYQVVILDEINVTVAFGILAEADVLDLLDRKPDGVELVLTGIRAPQAFIDRADLVTEMREVRHYYRTHGILSRKGIDR
ncbi:MAG: cob(I)yrinic acid a,c-diamide adenosyltransferase [Myxococcales bacterium]|nr:MAG: cob(I)yrinic acid a,c-diamide adenosyltransferase [Myxococcales bacterium]